MDLFEIIPSNFFNLFLSKNRELYIQSLILIYDNTKDNNFDLTENQCFIILSRHHSDKMFRYIPEDFDIEMPKDKVAETYARIVISSLCHYGWIERTPSVEEKTIYISIPSYSIQFIEAVKNILSPASFAAEKCITNIYSNIINVSKDNILSWIQVQNAYESMKNLDTLYSEMAFNIKIYYNQLLAQNKVSKLIEEHFDNYAKSELFSKYYSLKTDDNVFKFRYEIINRIDDIVNNESLLNVIAKQYAVSQSVSVQEAEDDIIVKLESIKSSLEDADRKQNMINKKHNQYVGATLDRINYLKNRDEDFKGNLVKVLNIISKDEDDRIFESINKQKKLMSSALYTEKALYRQKFVKDEFTPQEISIDAAFTDNDIIQNEKKNIIKKNIERQIYRFRDSIVKSFIDERIKDKESVSTEDFIIKDNDDFIKFVMAYKMCQEKECEYESRIINDDIIERGSFKLPNIEYRRKKH